MELISTGYNTEIGIVSNYGQDNQVIIVWSLFELHTEVRNCKYGIGYPDQRIYPDIVKDYNKFKKLDRVGVCVNIDSLELEYFYNGRSLQVVEPQKKSTRWSGILNVRF